MAVVFDFDGVLADTEPLHLRAFQDVFVGRGWTLDDESYAARYLGYDDVGLVSAFAADHGLRLERAEVQTLLDAKSRAFRRLVASGAVLFPGAKDCVQALDRRYPLAIASGALHAEIVDILGEAGLLSPFRFVVGADDVPRSKPHPDCYLRAAELLGVPPAGCVAIEDSHWGLTAARTAGMRTIAITTTTVAGELGAADRIVADLGSVTPEMIAGLLTDEARP